ncbi:MAG: PKD domain-containing protein [Bacteroidota bacterium]
MKRNITLIITLFCIMAHYSTFGQSYNMGAAGARTVTGCGITVYDNGGPSANYGNNRNDTMTILSGTPATPSVIVTLNEGDIANDDSLFIYNSNTADPTKIVFMGPLNAPFFNNSNMIILNDWSTYATIDNPAGAITLRFKSNGANSGTGFKITVSCQTPCQRIDAFIDSVASVPTPHRLTPDDGFRYMDVCENMPVRLVAGANFLDNNFAYSQRLDSCTFNWQLGDVIVNSTMGDSIITHTYVSGRGYDVVLTIRDHRQCFNVNFAGMRIRTSVNPISTVSPLTDMCTGTTRIISVGYSDSSNIIVTPVSSVQESSLSFDSTMFVPDGPNCTGVSDCYNTFVTFNSFLPGQTVTAAADILSICFTMEHSYLGDLQFRVVCPNSQSVITHSQPNGGGLWLGNAIDDSGGCSPVIANAGVGWNYCWSNYPGYSYHGTAPNYLHQGQTTRCDSSNRAAHTNFYHPMTSFAGLIGCPLNGTWSIEICDLYGIDDGWIFQWQLNLDPALLPTPWSYQIGITNVLWTGAFISQLTDTTALLAPAQGGTWDYTFSVIDEFGCAYDSVMVLNAVEMPTPNLGNDTAFCSGGTIIVVDPHYGIAGTTYRWSDFTNDPTLPILYPGTFSVTVTNSNGNIQCVDADTVTINYYPQPVAEFSATPTEGCSPLITQFTDLSTPDNINYTYAWDFGDPSATVNTSTEQNPIHWYNQYGNFDVTLSITSPEGCSAEIIKPGFIKVHPTPIAKFTPNPSNVSLSDNPLVSFANQTENYIIAETSWFWNFQDGTTSTEMSPTHEYTAPGDYTVTLVVTNVYGCSDTITHVVVVEDELFIPNIITPNGDYSNDVLVIGNINPNRENVLKVYNRWGKKIYEKDNYNTTALCKKLDPEGKSWQCGAAVNVDKGWNGEGSPDGVYFYTFHYIGISKTIDKNGSITIMDKK